METVLIKMIICSGILLGIYHLFLSKEKTYTFNRFYLIFSLVFSLIVTSVTIETETIKKEIKSPIIFENVEQSIIIQQETFDYNTLLKVLYITITIILFLKTSFSFLKIKRLKGRNLIYKDIKITLLKNNLAPFSFWNRMYLSENYFKDSRIDDDIFLHEKTHIIQKHSADIIFIEILKTFLWFNPFLYFYKKAMINNHEFMADENVISKGINVKQYQNKILREIIKQQNIPLTHQFNFNNTKTRFIMMTTKNTKLAKTKKYLTIPFFCILTFLFAEKTQATENKNSSLQTEKKEHLELRKKESIIDPYFNDQKNEIEKVKENNTLNDTIPFKKNIENKENLTKSEEKEIANITSEENTDIKPAEFPGGINNLRMLFANNFQSSILNGDEGTLKTTITFIVDKNGKVRDIKASGENEKFNLEAYRVTQLINQDVTWKSSTKNGINQDYLFKLPISMSFESVKKTL